MTWGLNQFKIINNTNSKFPKKRKKQEFVLNGGENIKKSCLQFEGWQIAMVDFSKS